MNNNTIIDFTPELIDDTSIIIDENNKNEHDDMLIKKIAIKKIGSKTFRTKIIEDFVRPNMIDDIKNGFLWRKRWSKISSSAFCFAEILGLIQTGLAFSAASFNLILISYLAGIFGVMCIAFNRFGSYSKNVSSDKTNQLNEILITVGITDKIPDLMDGVFPDNKKSDD
jgi:hypothetical protein